MKTILLSMVFALCAALPALGQSVSSVAIGGGGQAQSNGRTALTGQVVVAAFQGQGHALLLGAPNCWLAGGGGGGGGCNGLEVIGKANCATRNGVVTKLVVLVKGATPGQDYSAVLDSGQSLVRTANDRQKVKFVFKSGSRPPCGPNGVSVCNQHKSFNCSC